MKNKSVKKIRIIENTDPWVKELKEGLIKQIVNPSNAKERQLLKSYPGSVLVKLPRFGIYRVDQCEFEFVN